MRSLSFTINFHGPFHVLLGHADDGADLTVDALNPLPASSLKGVMRAAARLLPATAPSVDATFGTGRASSIWTWSDAAFPGRIERRRRSRIAIGEDGIVATGALVTFEEVWADRATFTIDQIAPAGDDTVEHQARVLAVAAGLVRSLGADRNRGFGWVGIRCDDHQPAELVESFGNDTNRGGR